MSNTVNLEHVQDDADLRRADKSYIVNVNDKKYLESLKRLRNLHRTDNIENSMNQTISDVAIIIERLDAIDLELIGIKSRLDILE